MRPVFAAVSLAVLALTFAGGTSAQTEEVRCQAIRDSAMCVAEPSCWYDAANNKGCLPGQGPENDRCAVHGSESICNTSSFDCAWNAADSKCASKSE